MIPTEQSFKAGNLAFDRCLRLVVERKFVARYRRSQIVLQRPPLTQLPIHVRLEEPN